LSGEFALMLAGGDRRSIGQADIVAQRVIENTERFGELWTCLTDADALVRMRAADALEKFSRACPAAFDVHKIALLANELDDGSAEVRWHLIAITSRITMERWEAERFCCHLDDCMRNDPSRIVKVAALQAAKDLQAIHPPIADKFSKMLAFARASIWPSVAARARRIGSTRAAKR
jgi:hypothetical protein